jgi:CRISPR-associated endonuclease/helicase Cas3
MCLETHGYSLEKAVDFCYDKFRQNGNLLVIVNTKAEALNVYRNLKNIVYDEETAIIHLSTNMCPQHRKAKINEMKKLLNEGKPIICVTTQLIEAGVDISFKCVVRPPHGGRESDVLNLSLY